MSESKFSIFSSRRKLSFDSGLALINKIIHQALIFFLLFVCTHVSIANDQVSLTKELAASLRDDPTKSIGLIQGERYVASLQNGDVLIVVKVDTNNNYEPIALAKLGHLPYPTAVVKNNVIIVHAGQGHHGTYNIEYMFRLKNNTFYLSKLRKESSYEESYNEPDIQIMEQSIINFDESIINHSKQRCNLNKKSERLAWENSMIRLRTNLPMLGGTSKTIKFKRKVYTLNNFNFDTDILSLTN